MLHCKKFVKALFLLGGKPLISRSYALVSSFLLYGIPQSGGLYRLSCFLSMCSLYPLFPMPESRPGSRAGVMPTPKPVLRLPGQTSNRLRHSVAPYTINFPGASTQTPQGCLPPASQERGIRPNLATLGASLRDASIGECTLNDSFTLWPSLLSSSKNLSQHPLFLPGLSRSILGDRHVSFVLSLDRGFAGRDEGVIIFVSLMAWLLPSVPA